MHSLNKWRLAAKGGPGVFREHALAFLDQIDGDSKHVSQAAEAFSVSVRRWAARKADTGDVENKAHAGQQRRVLDGEGDVLLMLTWVCVILFGCYAHLTFTRTAQLRFQTCCIALPV